MVTAPTVPPSSASKTSKVEALKERSQFLKEPVFTELQQDTNRFSEDGIQVLKFHGSYQQDDRDRRVKGQEKAYQFMLRTRTPGGFVPPQLYLTLDRLADEYGSQTLRATTRQAFQLHGILKKDLKTVMASIIKSMGSTLGACGDLNRNVMAPPAPFRDKPAYDLAWHYANTVADLLTPQTGAYYEIWLDGEKVVSGEEDPTVKLSRQTDNHGTLMADSLEPIYGTYYMPRKFKIAVTVPGDNSIDLLTQDLGLVVITNKKGELQGFNVYAGGGMGRTHNKEETFPRIADAIGFVEHGDIYDVVKAIVATQRDNGNRETRRLARMKYLIENWGVAKFRQVVEGYWGKTFQPSKAMPPFKYHDYLGWHDQGDGKLFVGLPVRNGRVLDREGFQLKTALREIIQGFERPMRVTANQNVLIYDIEPGDREAIQGILDRCGIPGPGDIDTLERYAMACPALPTCGLAITESERAIPGILERIRVLLDRLELKNEHFVIRMTGCPNGCARPYMAELGFVGTAPESYQLWLGGSPHQTRLAQPFIDRMPIDTLETTLEPLFLAFKLDHKRHESFGDFCHRLGFEELRQFMALYAENPDGFQGKLRERRVRYRVELPPDLHDQLKVHSIQQGKAIRDLAAEAIAFYLQHQQSQDG
ncbi:sulfite reductase, ferredoxin dependent [Prochlorothrix hollandica]|uniref:sulfite reductase, ferredoxin dependent n=1 Tax=Prochlorothrix hollandica TaxID=1223 RepID=UPI003342D609